MESVVGWMGGLRGVRITSNIFIIIFFFVFNYPIMTFLLGPMKVQEGDKLSKAPPPTPLDAPCLQNTVYVFPI